MRTQKIDFFQITRGATYKESFAVVDDNDSPIDLSNYHQIQMDIRKGTNRKGELVYSAKLDSEIIVGNSGTEEEPILNLITITIDSEDTDKWSGGIYYRDIVFVSDSKTENWVEGSIIVRENITQININN